MKSKLFFFLAILFLIVGHSWAGWWVRSCIEYQTKLGGKARQGPYTTRAEAESVVREANGPHGGTCFDLEPGGFDDAAGGGSNGASSSGQSGNAFYNLGQEIGRAIFGGGPKRDSANNGEAQRREAERQRLENQRLENQRVENQRQEVERQRLEKEKLEAERLKRERFEREKNETIHSLKGSDDTVDDHGLKEIGAGDGGLNLKDIQPNPPTTSTTNTIADNTQTKPSFVDRLKSFFHKGNSKSNPEPLRDAPNDTVKKNITGMGQKTWKDDGLFFFREVLWDSTNNRQSGVKYRVENATDHVVFVKVFALKVTNAKVDLANWVEVKPVEYAELGTATQIDPNADWDVEVSSLDKPK